MENEHKRDNSIDVKFVSILFNNMDTIIIDPQGGNLIAK